MTNDYLLTERIIKMIILNFSHPLTPAQRTQVEALTSQPITLLLHPPPPRPPPAEGPGRPPAHHPAPPGDHRRHPPGRAARPLRLLSPGHPPGPPARHRPAPAPCSGGGAP